MSQSPLTQLSAAEAQLCAAISQATAKINAVATTDVDSALAAMAQAVRDARARLIAAAGSVQLLAEALVGDINAVTAGILSDLAGPAQAEEQPDNCTKLAQLQTPAEDTPPPASEPSGVAPATPDRIAEVVTASAANAPVPCPHNHTTPMGQDADGGSDWQHCQDCQETFPVPVTPATTTKGRKTRKPKSV